MVCPGGLKTGDSGPRMSLGLCANARQPRCVRPRPGGPSWAARIDPGQRRRTQGAQNQGIADATCKGPVHGPDHARGLAAASLGVNIMSRESTSAAVPAFGQGTRALLRWAGGAAVVTALGLGACAVEIQNLQPARELARRAEAPGSLEAGWRVFQDKCANCHGSAATGTTLAPDLLPRMSDMGARRFVGLVLRRYDWNLPLGQASGESAAREALIDEVMQRKQGAVTMPAWEGGPSVNAHILDIHAWLSARAEGRQAPGRPLSAAK